MELLMLEFQTVFSPLQKLFEKWADEILSQEGLSLLK